MSRLNRGAGSGGKTELSWIIKSVRTRVPALVVMLASYVGSSLLVVAFALGSSRVVDTAISGVKDDFVHACIVQALIIAGIVLCLTVYRHLKDRLMADLDRDWKKRLLHKLLHGDYAEVTKFHSAEVINRMNNDVRILDDGIVSMIPNVAGMATQLIAAMSVLVVLDPVFAGCLMCVGVLLIVITGILRGKLKGLNKRVSEHEGKVLGFLQEALENLLAVQAMDVQDEMEHRADGLLNDRYEVQRRRKNVTLFANTSITVLSYAATFITLVWCSAKLMNGLITFGTLTAMIQLVGQLRGPLVNMSGIMPRYAAMTAAADRLMEIENVHEEEVEVEVEEPGTSLYDQMTALGGSNLTFSYDRDEILKDASFTLPKGAFAAVAGPSGTGKSTLLKLMLGIFKADSGVLYMEAESGDQDHAIADNQSRGRMDLADTDAAELRLPLGRSTEHAATEHIQLGRATRKLFAYVPQNNLLFSGTLLENLLIVKPGATASEIEHAAYVSAMDEYLDQLPEGLDTVIGEGAAGLSEGQAQRLAIARAILGGAPVLLLDESTSALDAATEQLVLERIKALPDKTCIAVTHRPAALELCDYRLEMQDGQIKTLKC